MTLRQLLTPNSLLLFSQLQSVKSRKYLTRTVVLAVAVGALTACGPAPKLDPKALHVVTVDGVRCIVVNGGWKNRTVAVSCDWSATP